MPNLHVSPKTEIYLDFSIKNAGFVFAVEICDFSVFVYNLYSFNIYMYIVVELSVFIPNAAIFILERNLIRADFLITC